MLKAEWVKIVVKSIKGFKGVPSNVDRKKLSLQKRINYFVNSKNFKFRRTANYCEIVGVSEKIEVLRFYSYDKFTI